MVLHVSMGEVCFSDGRGFIFKWGGHPMGGINFDGEGGGVSKKNVGWGLPPMLPTMGNPVLGGHLNKIVTFGTKHFVHYS